MNSTQISEILNPVIGQCVWKATQGYGSMLNINITEQVSFFLFMCSWKIFASNKVLAHDESEREEIETALNYIIGKSFRKIILRVDKNIAEIYFDLDCRIIISDENYKEDIYEMWSFYTAMDYVLTYRNDHKIAFDEPNTKYDESIFKYILGEPLIETK